MKIFVLIFDACYGVEEMWEDVVKANTLDEALNMAKDQWRIENLDPDDPDSDYLDEDDFKDMLDDWIEIELPEVEFTYKICDRYHDL